MLFVIANDLMREFALPKTLANDIANTEWQRALRRHWQPWAWLLPCWLAAAWLWLHGPAAHFGSIMLMIAGANGWIQVARWLAGPAMLAAARAKADRMYPAGVPATARAAYSR